MKKLILFALLIVSFMSHAQRPAITGGSYNIVIDTNSLSNRINNADTKINNHLFSDNDTIIGNEVDSIWKSGLTYYIQKGANTFTLTDSAGGGGGIDTDSQSIYLSNDTLYITRGNFAIIPSLPINADSTNDAWKNTTGLVSLTTLSNGVVRNDAANVFIRDDGTVRVGSNVDLGGATNTKLQLIHETYNIALPHAIITGSNTVSSPTGIYLRSTTGNYLTYPNVGSLIFDRSTVPNRTEVMRLTANNRVGLSTTTPTTTLDVNGTFRVRLLGIDNSDTILSIVADGTVYKKYVPISFNLTNNSTSINSSGALILPKGTTAQRPAIGIAGMERFNTTYNGTEYYDGTNWILIRAVLSTDPTGFGAGSTYYNSTTGTMRYFDGTIWQNY